MCSTGAQMAERFAIAARKYAEAAAKLGASHVHQRDYVKILDDAEQAIRQAEEAREAFKQHIYQHQCGAGGAAAG